MKNGGFRWLAFATELITVYGGFKWLTFATQQLTYLFKVVLPVVGLLSPPI